MLLVTGASGFVGQHLLALLNQQSASSHVKPIPYMALTGRSKSNGGTSIDLVDPMRVAELFRGHRFDGIIHLAAESRTGLCQDDPAMAIAVNADGTRNLLQGAATQGSWFLYVSTDMVFSGREGNYRATDSPAPILEYGRSKLLAEESVTLYPGPWCIVRPALIYGAPAGGRESMLSWTLENLRSGTGRFFVDELRTPVWVDDLARLLLTLYRNKHTGVVHAGGPDKLSRYEFACAVAREWGIPPENGGMAKAADLPDASWRPRDVSLVSDEAARLIQFHSTADALQRIHATGKL